MRFWTPKVLSENTIATGGRLQCQLLCRNLLWRHSLWRHSLWRVMLRRVRFVPRELNFNALR
eukprot:1675613-Prymnesium_polylepis.1